MSVNEPMELNIEITSNLQFLERSNIREPLQQFGEWWRDVETPNQFSEQRTADGERWKELSPRYRDWKASKGYSTTIGKKTVETYDTRGFHVQEDGIELGYVANQSEYFSAARPLFTKSGEIPGAYAEELSRLIINYLNG